MILGELLTDEAKKHLKELEDDISALKEKRAKETNKLTHVTDTLNSKLKELSDVTDRLSSIDVEVNKMVDRALEKIRIEKENINSELESNKTDLNITNHHLNEARTKIMEYESDLDRLNGKIDEILQKERTAQELFRKSEELNADTTKKRDEFIDNPQSIGYHVANLQAKLDKLKINFNVLKEL